MDSRRPEVTPTIESASDPARRAQILREYCERFARRDLSRFLAGDPLAARPALRYWRDFSEACKGLDLAAEMAEPMTILVLIEASDGNPAAPAAAGEAHGR